MSQEITVNTNNQAFINTDTTKTFVWNNRYQQGLGNITNSTYDDVTYLEGTVLGRIASSQKLVPMKSGASDGSQFPVGILKDNITVAAGATYTSAIWFCHQGDVDVNKIKLQGSDTLATVVSLKSIRDRIASDAGINLVGGTSLVNFDHV